MTLDNYVAMTLPIILVVEDWQIPVFHEEGFQLSASPSVEKLNKIQINIYIFFRKDSAFFSISNQYHVRFVAFVDMVNQSRAGT